MPDIRWHDPHASAPPCPLVTIDGAGGWSLGNQSGGAIRLSISSAVWVLSLPASFFGPASAGSDACCTGNAHAGSFGGGVFSCSGLTACCAEYTPADNNTNTPMNANLRIELSPFGGSKRTRPPMLIEHIGAGISRPTITPAPSDCLRVARAQLSRAPA